MLPTDEEYLDSLYHIYHDPLWAELWHQIMPGAMQRYIVSVIGQGHYSEKELELLT